MFIKIPCIGVIGDTMTEVKEMRVEDFGEYVIQEEATEGVVKGFGEVEIRTTKFGERKVIPIIVETEAGEVTINLFLNPDRKQLHPNSNAYRLLRRVGVKSLKDLVGRKVPLRIDNRGFYRFDV